MQSSSEKRIIINVEKDSIMIYDEVAEQRIDVLPKDVALDKIFYIIKELLES